MMRTDYQICYSEVLKEKRAGRALEGEMIGFLFWLGVDICMRPGSDEDFGEKIWVGLVNTKLSTVLQPMYLFNFEENENENEVQSGVTVGFS
jgi:hypothetical protein